MVLKELNKCFRKVAKYSSEFKLNVDFTKDREYKIYQNILETMA